MFETLIRAEFGRILTKFYSAKTSSLNNRLEKKQTPPNIETLFVCYL